MANREHQWQSKRLKLPQEHGWRASPGHNVFVADQGAVRFEYPATWIVEPIKNGIAVGLYDKVPPDDDVRLAVSVMNLPQHVDWSPVPLDMLVRQAFMRERPHDVRRDLAWQSKVRAALCGDVETAWAEGDFIDPAQHRGARTRAGLARGGVDYIVQAQITMDYWLEDAERFEPVWDHALSTLRLGEIIPNPLTHRDG